MSYELTNNGASIKIVNESLAKLVMKHHISEVSLIRQNIIKITRANLLETIYLPYAEVELPVTLSAVALRDQVNTWITDCVCCDCAAGGGGGEEEIV